MKKRFTAVAALAALLVCALAGAALADGEPRDTLETEVSIGFTGAVYFVDMGSDGMDIDFGSHMIPPRGEAAYLPASDGSHTLRVCDRRTTPGKWTVYAIITPMASGENSFLGHGQLYDATTTPGLTPTIWTGKCVLINTSVYRIMEAASTITPGEYDLTATAENTRLWIDVADVAKIKPLAYSATITWTLVLTP